MKHPPPSSSLPHESHALSGLTIPTTCLFPPHRVRTAITTMANAITETLSNTQPLVLCVLNGGIILTGQLLPQLPFPLQLDTVHATRYRGNTQGKQVQWKSYPSCSMTQRHVLIIDDILDKGITLKALRQFCYKKGAAHVYTAVLVEKQTERDPDNGLQHADFTGLQVPDTFIVGHGMDYQAYGRNTQGIYTLSKEK